MTARTTRIVNLKTKYDKIVLESEIAINNIQNVISEVKGALTVINDYKNVSNFKESYINIWDKLEKIEHILIEVNLNFDVYTEEYKNKCMFSIKTLDIDQKIEKILDDTLQMESNDILNQIELVESPKTINSLDEMDSEYNYRINLLNKSDESSKKHISNQKRLIQYGPPSFQTEDKQKINASVEKLKYSERCSKEVLNKNTIKTKVNTVNRNKNMKKLIESINSSSVSMEFGKNNPVSSYNTNKSVNKENKTGICVVENKKSYSTLSDNSEDDLQNEHYEESQYFSTCSRRDSLSEIEDKVIVHEIPSYKIPEPASSCIITYYESPSCFYIMVVDEITEQYDFLHETLEKICQKEDCFKDLTKIKFIEKNAELYFACYFQDSKLDSYPWHRCKIVDWFLGSEEYETKLKVYFLDEGFQSIVDISDLCTLPLEAYSFPPMAYKCYLAYIYPPGSTPEKILDEWPQESIDTCKEILQSEQYFKIVSCEMTNKGLSVILINEVKSYIFVPMVTCNIATLILPDEIEDSKFCFKSEFMRSQIYRAQGFLEEDVDQWSHSCKEIDSKKQISEAVEGGYTPRDYARICKFTDNTGQKCFKGNKCYLEHGFLHPDGWTTDKQFIYSKTNEFCIKRGLKLNLMVTHIVNGVTFYACIQSDKNSGTLDVISLKTLTNLINDPKRVKTYKPLQFLPSLGELILAEHEKFLYRARVVDVSEDFIEVFYIDYGNKSKLTMKELREIQPDMVHFPEQALLFRIVNVETDKETEVKSEKYLRSEVLDNNVCALVCDEVDNLIEALIYINNIDVGRFMIAHKLAKSRQNVVQ